ncbi:putative Mn2+ efflux pump MntP [Desulfohalotomaculum tongense]|uniref:manganese efflux pump MntP n=1 Tax=Desulforadius tongensis TaxID=1216062 RepID=UPI00195B9E32|nr:manganese efflux pump [Desulforadius tongensis]MBM7853745.1 putative Mn2+ efflux pump MntP [Desulforadius tongensis]
MSLVTLFLLAAALGTDAMSLCVGIGMSGVLRRQVYVLTFTIAVFHVIMPIAGYYAGELVGRYIGRAAAIAGALLLIYLGVKMIKDMLSEEEEQKILLANTGGLVMLAASVSMDALSVGFTLGTRTVNLYQAAAVMGAVAGMMTYAGLTFGRYVGNKIGRRAQMAGGIILIGIGIKLFF